MPYCAYKHGECNKEKRETRSLLQMPEEEIIALIRESVCEQMSRVEYALKTDNGSDALCALDRLADEMQVWAGVIRVRMIGSL